MVSPLARSPLALGLAGPHETVPSRGMGSDAGSRVSLMDASVPPGVCRFGYASPGGTHLIRDLESESLDTRAAARSAGGKPAHDDRFERGRDGLSIA